MTAATVAASAARTGTTAAPNPGADPAVRPDEAEAEAATADTAEIPAVVGRDQPTTRPEVRTGGIVRPTNVTGGPRQAVSNTATLAARSAAPPPGTPTILAPGETDTPRHPARAGATTAPDAAAMAPGAALATSTRAMLQRRRIPMLVAFVMLAVIVLVVGQMVQMRGGADRVRTVSPVASALPPAVGVPTATPAATPGAARSTAHATVPGAAATGAKTGQAPADTADSGAVKAAGTAGVFDFTMGYGPVLGTAGTLRRFKVAVEKSLGQGNGGDFAAEIDRTLGDPRSWIASRQFRLQRVPQTAASEFTVYLASARTSEKMCAVGGLDTDGFTSCRLPGQVIVNNERWQDAVPDYGAPLEVYRAYALNHEVGHQFGHGHETCPAKGRPAPVMMQQTYGLRGCVANSWPYVDGKRYTGPPVA